MIEIRRAERRQVGEILRITNEEAARSIATAAYHDEPLERWESAWDQEHEAYPWLVAIQDAETARERVIAYAKASPFNPRDGFMWSVSLSVYLETAQRGTGLAAQLYELLFSLLRAQGYQAVYARVALPNPASIKLHERFGLKQTGLLPQFSWKFDRWYDLAILTGRLSELKGPPPALKSVTEVWELKRP